MAPIATSPVPVPATIASAITKPIKPLLRRATLSGTVRTRDEAGLDIDDPSMSVPSSPTKRARTVTFNPTVQEQIFSSSPTSVQLQSELKIVRLRTRVAIENHVSKTNSEDYDELKAVFASQAKRSRETRDGDMSDSEEMRLYLLALTSYVSLLGKDCNGLVRAVLDCEWVGRDITFVNTYIQFLANLASAQGSYVSNILVMVVDKFAGMRLSSGRLLDCPIVNREELSARLHMALRYFLRLIPSGSGTLSPIICNKFPWSDDSKRVHTTYINNLVKLIEYAPELKGEVFALITERLVKIDVQMQVDLDDLDDEVAAAIVQGISHEVTSIQAGDDDFDGEEEDSDIDSITSDDIDDDSERIKQVQDSVEKMDAMLDILFTIYTPYFDNPDSLTATSTFETLLTHFRNIILPTYRSRHTQFLLFHFAQKSDTLVDAFAGECVDLAFKSGRPAVLKQSAAAYLASFVSRGAHVLPHTVREVFEYIGANLDKIRMDNEAGCRGPDLHRYGTFYATTQALLYIFCFRWRDLIILPDDDQLDEDEDYHTRDLEWNAGVRELLIRTIYSKLNPLRICAPSIVEEFARISTHLRFMFVYPLIETNKRVRLSQFALGVPALRDSGVGTASAEDQESWNHLDAYFPFDPYQLPKSRRWIEDDYVQWRGIPGMKTEEDDDDESTEAELEGEDEEIEDDEDTATEDEW